MTRNEAIARCMEYEIERDSFVHRIAELEGELQQRRAKIVEAERLDDSKEGP